jgi:hypothetical protein
MGMVIVPIILGVVFIIFALLFAYAWLIVKEECAPSHSTWVDIRIG